MKKLCNRAKRDLRQSALDMQQMQDTIERQKALIDSYNSKAAQTIKQLDFQNQALKRKLQKSRRRSQSTGLSSQKENL